MTQEEKYQKYLEGNTEPLSFEAFNAFADLLSDEDELSFIEGVKKKDPPSGEEELTPIQGQMATEPIFQNMETPLPTIEKTTAPNLSVLGTTESPISTASASEIGVSSLGEDYSTTQNTGEGKPDLSISQANPVSNPLGYNSDINGGEDDIKLPIKTYKDYTAELKEISTDLKGVQNKISSYVSQLNNINQSIKEKNEYIQGLNNNPIIKEIESLSMQMKDIDVNNIKSYEEENAIKRYNALVGSAEYRTLAESINKGIGEINALQNQYQSISESEAFKTLNEQEKSIIGKYNGIIGSEAYKQSISEENKRLQAEQKGNSILEEPSNNDVKPSVSKKLFYGVNAEGDTVTISNKNFTKTDKSLVAKDGNTYEIYKREGLSFIETDEGLKLVGNDGDVSKYPLFGKDFEFYKGKLLYNSEKEDSPTDIYKAQRRNFHYVAGGTLSSGLEEKDITGKFISLEDETELYKSYESKGYGNILGIDEYTKRPIFKLNEVGAKALNEENEFSVPSDYDKGKAYAIDQNRVMSEINEGKEIEDNERHRQEKILGRKIAGALLTEEEIKEELVAKRTQQLLSQGYDAQQARQQADREWVGTQLQKQKASNEWIDYIVSEAENNNVVNGKSSKYHQFTNSERETWHSLKDDIDFAEFISSDYVKNKYGTKGGGLEYHFENTKLRKSFLDDYIQYKQKRLSDNRRALNSTRDRQYRMDIRVAMDNGDDTALATAREKRKPIEREYQNIQQKALENSILANKIENGFDIIKKENKKIAEEYAGYQNGRLGDVASYTGKSIINGGGKLITDVVGGFLSLGGMFSDKINSYHTAFNVENSQFFNVLSGNPTDKVTVYKKGDIIVEERLGKMFIKGNDGSLSFSEELTYNPKAFDGFKEVDKYTDENLASWGGMIVNQVAMMYVPSAGGGMLAKVTANSTRLNKIISVSSNVLGKEHLLTKSLVSFSHNSKNIYTSALWAMEVQNQNYHEAKNAGLTRQQAGVYSIIQSGLTGALVHFSPDEKFFKGYNSSQKSIIDLIAKNDWVKLKSYTTDFVKKAIVSSRGELLQENSEVVANNIVNTIFNQVLDEKKLNEWSVDEFIETGKSTLGTTSFLEAINYLTRGGIKTRGLSNIEKMVVASQIPEIQKQLQEVENGVWGSDIKRDAREALQYIAKIQKYTKQIPDDIHLKTSETADLVLSMDKIAEFEKKKNETDYPSIKESYDEKIQAENDKIKNILSGAKKNITNGDSNIEGNKEISQPQNSNIINNEEEQGRNSVADVEQLTSTNPQEGADVIEYNGKLYTIQGNDVKDQNGNSVPKKDQATILEQGKIVSNQQQGEQENISEQNIPEQKNEEEEDVDIDFSNSLYTNARIQGNNPPNDGTTGLGAESLPNTERGQDNPQGVSQTANLGGSETKAEITPRQEEQKTQLLHLEDDNYTFEKIESVNKEGDKVISIQKTDKKDFGFGINTAPSYHPIEEYGYSKNDIIGLPSGANDVEVESIIERKNGGKEAIIYFKENGKVQKETFSIRNSAGSFRKGDSKNKEIVWSLPAVENETLTNSEKVSPNTPKGKQGNRLSGNSSQTISTNKNTKKSTANQNSDVERSNEIIENKSKDGYTYTKYADGREVITSPKGTEISRYNKNGKVNANFEKNKAKIFGEKTNNEINQEYTRRKKEALDWFIPTNARDVVLKFFAEGGKVSAESISKNVLGNSESLLARGKARRKLTDYKWAFLGKGKPHSIEATAERLSEEYDYIDEIEIRNEIIDVINSYGKVSDIQDEILDLYQKSNDPYYGYTDEDIAKMEYWSLSEKERALVDDIKTEEELTEEERIAYYTELYYKQIQSLGNGEQEQIYQEWAKENEISRATRQHNNNLRERSSNDIRGSERNQYEGKSLQGGEKQVGENEGSRTIESRETSERPSQSGNGKKSPEYRELLKQKEQAEQNEKHKKANLDKVSRELNAQFQADQEDLFGNRASQQEAVLFDERADAEAGIQEIEKAKQEYKQAKAETRRINRKLKDIEDGKIETTGDIDFQRNTPYKKGKITNKAFGKLVEKLQKHFGKAFKKGVNITTDWNEFQKKAEAYQRKKAIKRLWDKAISTNTGTETITIGNISENGKKELEKLSGLNFDKVDFINLNQSNLRHIYKDHFAENEKDRGNNVPLSEKDIEQIPDVINSPNEIIYGRDKNGVNMFFFLKEGEDGTMNIVQVYSGKNRNLNIRSVYKTKKGFNQRADEIISSLSTPKKRSGAYLSDAKIINNFENAKIESENNTDLEYLKTPSGVIYGAKLPDGSLYINPEHLNANTPIHEFGHIWEQLMPQRFAEGVKLLQNTKAGKELFQELRNNNGYENYSDDSLWNEALVTMLGNRGEELYHSNSASKFVAWVKDFFKALGEYLHKMSGGKIGKELTPDDKMQTFMKGALSEIMGAKEIIPESNVAKKEVPIYLKDMTNAEIRTMLENMNLVVPAKCA